MIARRRVVKPKVVWRRQVVKVRDRVPHRHVRRERQVTWRPHTRVWTDKKGRRHERTVMRKHVQIVRHVVIRWRVRVVREVRRVRTVVRRVQVVARRECS